MIEVSIYDEEDREAKQPGSFLGYADSFTKGMEIIVKYIKNFPNCKIYKIEMEIKKD